MFLSLYIMASWKGTFALLLKFTGFLQKGISSFQIYAEGKKSADLTLRAIHM